MSVGTTHPHVLVVGEFEADPSDREWEVEHSESCPVEHFYGYEWVPWLGLMPYHSEHLACYVQYEIDANGIDSLIDKNGQEWRTWSFNGGGEVGLDQTLPPGRYLVEGWWNDGAGMGDYGGRGDADGGLTLLGSEPDVITTRAERSLLGATNSEISGGRGSSTDGEQ